MALNSFFRRSAWPLTCGLVLACGGSQPEPQTPPAQPYPGQTAYPQQQYPAGQPPQYPQQQYPQQQQPYPQQPQQPYPQQPAPQQYPGAPPAPPAPGAVPGAPPAPPGGVLPPTETPGPLATPIDPSAAAAVQPILSQLAASKAPAGSKPIGSVMAANFQQGQQLEAQVQMEPGRCYTLIGAGLPPTVTEVDLKLVAITPMAGMAPILAVDNTTGVQAVLGERPNCFKWAWPISAPVKVVLSVTGGSGLAAAQLFGK
jgi:hypothetical protein